MRLNFLSVGRPVTDFIWPEDLAVACAALAQAGTQDLNNIELRYRHQDGTPRWISWHTSREGNLLYGYGRDVTALKEQAQKLQQAQEALRQSQKL